MPPYRLERPRPGPAAGAAALPPSAPPGPWCAHARCRQRALGRRTLLGAAAGATAALGAAPWPGPAALAAPPTPQDPKPIPGGLDPGGGLPFIHVMAPGVAGFPIDDEPSTITDFNGVTAYAIIDGAGVGTDTATGATKRYTTNVDMRVMAGAYVGADGRHRHGTFGFV